MDRIVLNRVHETEVNAGQTLTLGSEGAAGSANNVDFDSLNDTLYGFYTTRAIEIIAVEHIVVQTHACDATAGVASLMSGSTTYAKVTAVDAKAAHDHISGVLESATKVAAGVMLYVKVTTASTDSGTAAGEGYFIVTYK